MRPISTSCQDHMGSTWARVAPGTAAGWEFRSDWYQADEQIIKPMVKACRQVRGREEADAAHGRLPIPDRLKLPRGSREAATSGEGEHSSAGSSTWLRHGP